MSTDFASDLRLEGPDWRLRFSLALTVVWLLLGLTYISGVVGWTDFVRQNAPSLGSFLEGAFAPLAFLWLVVGFFLQQKQLSQNTKTIQMQLVEMRRTAQQAEIQSRAIAADELHSRQDTFLRVAEIVNEQLGSIGGYIVSSYMEAGSDMVELWTRLGQGDSGVFGLRILYWCYLGEVSPAELFYGTEIRTGHTERFIAAFERLEASALRCDPEEIISEAIRDSTHGRVYRFMVDSRPDQSRASSAPA
jgi:hypothetical protein